MLELYRVGQELRYPISSNFHY